MMNKNFRVEQQSDAELVGVGDIVRSFDFEGRDDCFVLGQITAIGVMVEGCPRYEIVGFQRWFGGEVVDFGPEADDRLFYPPMNGTPNWLGGYTNFVRRLDPDQEAIWKEKLRDHAEDLAGDHYG